MYTYPPKLLHLWNLLGHQVRDPASVSPAQISQAVADSRFEYDQFLESEAGRKKHEKYFGKIAMPLNLPNLPLLAQRHVLQSMRPMDAFLLTLFFPKFRTLAKLIRWCESPAIHLGEIQALCPTLYLRTSKEDIPIIQFKVLESSILQNKKTTTERKIDNRMLKIGIDAGEQLNDPPIITCEQGDVDFVWTSLLKNFQETFRLPQQIDLYVMPSTFEILPKTENLRKLTIERCKMAPGTNTFKIDCEDIERFFGKTFDNKKQTMKVLHMIPDAYRILDKYSKMLAVDSLLMHDAWWLTGENFSHFCGKQLMLVVTKLRTQDVINFLVQKKFCLGQFEFAIVRQGNFNVDQILRTIQSQPWDPTKRDARYTPMSQLEFPVSEEDFDCTNARDIVIGCTRMLASFKITPNQFHFFVWRNIIV